VFKQKNHNFIKFADVFERYLIRFIIANLVILIAFQIILTQENLRIRISRADVIETAGEIAGTKEVSGGVLEKGEIQPEYLTLELDYHIALPKLKILVNGMNVADFSSKQVVLRVKNGDLIEIDGTYYPYTVGVKVISNSPLIVSPKVGDKIFVNGSIESLGKINIQGVDLENLNSMGYNGNNRGDI